MGRGFEATTDFSRASEVDALILCVPTPLDSHRAPDLSFVLDTVESLLPHMHAGQVISLESTTYPGTTEEDIRPRIENTGLVVGRDIFLVYSPEREDPGNPSFTTRTIPKICGGSTPACLEAGLALYDQVIDQVVPVSSTQVAELTKLLENIHRAVNIGLVNEMKLVADKMGIAYKKNVDDMRESPSVEIMSQLQQQGANLDYSDPHVPVFPNMRRYRFDLKSIELTAEILAGYDCVVLGTDHDVFDYELIGRHAKLIVDTRGRYRKGAEKIIKA